jgi:hypothetical protein
MKTEIQRSSDTLTDKRMKYFTSFKANLLSGIEYYQELAPKIKGETEEFITKLKDELENIKESISEYSVSETGKFAFQLA